MARRQKQLNITPAPPPAKTPEDREKQMVGYAVDVAERQLREGTASAQVITHYLKLASSKDKQELEILKLKGELLKAQTEKVKAEQRSEEVYREALSAFRLYQGTKSEEEYEE